MKGDFTRIAFDPSKHYRGVRMQQGRVQLDSDWNEQIDIQAWMQRMVTDDLLGLEGAPQIGGGFRVTVSSDGSSLLISPGRMYVDGFVCELDASTAYGAQADYPAAVVPAGNGKDASGNFVYLAYLDAWDRHVTSIEDPGLLDVALGGADTSTRVQTVAQVKLAALSSDGTTTAPVPAADWTTIITPSQAALLAVPFVPDAPGALSLGGTAAGFVTLPAFGPALSFTRGFTVEAWVLLRAAAPSAPILSLNDPTSAANAVLLGTSAADGTALQLTVGTATCTAAGALDPGVWTHVAVSIDPSGHITMYKNGNALTVTGTVGLPPGANRTRCWLGSSNGSNASAFSGALAEVRVWSVAMAPSPSNRLRGTEPGLVAYYKLNEMTGAAIGDGSSSGLNGTAGGAFAWSTAAPALVVAGASTSQYTGPENQLYRVEIHSVDASSGVVTFKWSRDNGSVALSAVLSDPQTLTLSTPARDDVLGWAVGQWIEMTTPAGDLQGVPGTLAQITAVRGAVLTIQISGAAPALGAVTVRRWDSDLGSAKSTVNPGSSTWPPPWMQLENGIAVQFGGAVYKPGDYWVMAARTGTQSIVWPRLASGQPQALRPAGILHAYAQLAKVYRTPGGTWVASPLPELRQTFASLQHVVRTTGAISWDDTSVQVNGTFTATKGLTVTGGPLTVTGQPLNAGGMIFANAGLTVTGGALNVGTGTAPQPLNVYGPVSANAGLTVNGGMLTANVGLTVNGGMLTANAGLTVTGAFTANGPALARAGLVVSGGALQAQAGLAVSGAALTVGASGTPQTLTAYGPISAQAGLTVSGGILQAQAGLTVSGGILQVQTTLTVAGPATMQSGLMVSAGTLSANAGLTVNGGVLAVNGSVVTANGFLNANAGIRVQDQPIYLHVDANHGLVYGGAAANTTQFSGSNDVDGPVLYGWSGGGLGTSVNGHKYTLKWDSNGNVAVTGGVGATNLTANNGNGTALIGNGSGANGIGISSSGTKYAGYFIGNILVTGTGHAAGGFATASTDLAETFEKHEEGLEPGDVVAADPTVAERLIRSTAPRQDTVVGVISEKPGFMLGVSGEDPINPTALALAGRVPVKVTLEGGPIRIGDYLTSASEPGHAMRANRPCRSLGMALSAFDGVEGARGKVIVLVNLHYFAGC